MGYSIYEIGYYFSFALLTNSLANIFSIKKRVFLIVFIGLGNNYILKLFKE